MGAIQGGRLSLNASPSPQIAPSETRSYTSWVIAIVLIGLLITAVDTTIVVMGLPVIMKDLHAPMDDVVWVIMGYLLVLTMLTTQVGRLGDMFGRVRMYNMGFVVFTLGSVLCGLSTTSTALIAFRVVQGLGGALITANSGAIIADSVPPHERGRAFGFIGMGWSFGAILGILLGGILITFVNWQAVFFINLPIGIIALFLSYRILKEHSPRIQQKLDFLGIVLLGGGLFLLLLGLVDLAGGGWSFTPAWHVGAGALLLITFVAWETRQKAPLIELSLFRERILSASILAAFFQSLGSFAVLFLVIMYLQGVRGLSPLDASLLLVPGYLAGGFLGPVAGRVADKRGARLPATVGLILQAAAFVMYSTLTLATPYAVIIAASVVNGVGNSAFFPSNNSAVVANAPPKAYGVANGVLRTFSNVGMMSSFAVALLLASAAIPRQAAFAIFVGVTTLRGQLASDFVSGLHAALYGSIAIVAVAAVLSVLRGREDRAARTRAHEAAGR